MTLLEKSMTSELTVPQHLLNTHAGNYSFERCKWINDHGDEDPIYYLNRFFKFISGAKPCIIEERQVNQKPNLIYRSVGTFRKEMMVNNILQLKNSEKVRRCQFIIKPGQQCKSKAKTDSLCGRHIGKAENDDRQDAVELLEYLDAEASKVSKTVSNR